MDEILAICSTENTGNTIGIDAHCINCDTKVWLSDSTIKSIKSSFPDVDLKVHPPTILCMLCGMKRIKDTKDVNIMPPTDEQVKEIERKINNI